MIFSGWRRIAWRYPEWWSVALSGIGWVTMWAWPHGPGMSHVHVSHAMAASMGPAGSTPVWTGEMLRWMIMVIAMMFPLVLGAVRMTAARSLWSRRHRAIAGFLAGYLGRWLLFGAAACVVVSGMRTRDWYNPPLMAAVGFGLALVWQFAPGKQRGLRACHRTVPIAPTGWRADRDCLRYGWMVGGGCLLSCGALMLACLLAGHGLAAMACASVVGVAERYQPRPDQRMICGAISVCALAYAAVALR